MGGATCLQEILGGTMCVVFGLSCFDMHKSHLGVQKKLGKRRGTKLPGPHLGADV